MNELIDAGRTRGAALAGTERAGDGTLLIALADGWANALAVVDQWWMQALRQEAEAERYATAVAAEDAEALYALLAEPYPTFPDPVPIAAVRVDLSRALLAARLQGNATWVAVLQDQRDLLANAREVPRAELAALQVLAEQAGILPAEYQAGRVDRNRLDALGLAGVVTAPAHVARAMGW